MKTVLMYHDIFEENPDESGFLSKGATFYKISQSLFEQHVRSVRALIDKDEVLEEDVVFTFDDGGCSAENIIAPILERYGFHGYFFIATNFIGDSHFLSEEQIKKLYDRGHYIGAHSNSHPSNISQMDMDQRRQEWEISVTRLSQITSSQCSSVSIPNGFFCKEDIGLFNELGIKRVFTSFLLDNKTKENVEIIGRVAINVNTSSFELEKILTSRLFRWRICFVQRVLLLFKKILGSKYIVIKKRFRERFS